MPKPILLVLLVASVVVPMSLDALADPDQFVKGLPDGLLLLGAVGMVVMGLVLMCGVDNKVKAARKRRDLEVAKAFEV